MADLSISRVSKRLGTQTAVRDLQLDIASGELVVLLGPLAAPGKPLPCALLRGWSRPTVAVSA